MPVVRTPGELLGSASAFSPGEGVYQKGGDLRASAVGIEKVSPPPNNRASMRSGISWLSYFQWGPVFVPDDLLLSLSLLVCKLRVMPLRFQGLPVLSILRAAQSRAAVARVGSLVLGQVTAVNRMLVEVAVLAVDGHVLPEPYKGAIRAQDVRETIVENFDIAECFQPSDVVRAEVLSADGRVYLLGTAADDLGVLCADSKAGGALQPVSALLMRCSLTGQLERRKVARPPGV
ncbi:3 -5 exoribonuclease [Cyclospora cayetanensis]|uniref:3-5 exoribonuclease n=1 Tax=Cyclospora cayetanensis TaxID=88456 RepID=A0A1D3D1Y3_9EIME|nr:3 -5 exoribonuclease [Cyclospora cayetanensis]